MDSLEESLKNIRMLFAEQVSEANRDLAEAIDAKRAAEQERDDLQSENASLRRHLNHTESVLADTARNSIRTVVTIWLAIGAWVAGFFMGYLPAVFW